MKNLAFHQDETFEFSLRFSESYIEDIFRRMERVSEFFIQEISNETLVGFLECRKSANDVKSMKSVTGLKRSLSTLKIPPKAKSSKADSGPQNVPAGRKDIHSALKDLDLLPQIGPDLGCSMCPYVATKKSHLKTHYKLKHLGGADLIMTCQICSTQVKTKSYMKKHYMKVHNLSEVAAQNMTSSS